MSSNMRNYIIINRISVLHFLQNNFFVFNKIKVQVCEKYNV